MERGLCKGGGGVVNKGRLSLFFGPLGLGHQPVCHLLFKITDDVFVRAYKLYIKNHKRQQVLYSPSFISIRLHGKQRHRHRLVLVASAGSATTGSLELPALGADVGPGKEE